MAKQQTYKEILIAGFGKTGQSFRAYTKKKWPRAHTTFVVDENPSNRVEAKKFAEDGEEVILGGKNLQGKEFDVVFISPGISPFGDLFQSMQGLSAPILGEPDVAFGVHPKNWIAITGTNGKTTTTALTAALLEGAGLHADAVGNIGESMLGQVTSSKEKKDDFVVAELSSYQLALTNNLHAYVAILLNISEDHRSWHKTHAHYVRSKARIFQNMASDNLAIISIDDSDSASIAKKLEEKGETRVMELSTVEEPQGADAAFMRGDELIVRLDGKEHNMGVQKDMQLRGKHNAQNMLAASAAALFAGGNEKKVQKALSQFQALPHRNQWVGEVGGVSFINDSKATNTDAALRSIETQQPGKTIALFGGRDKGGDLAGFALACAATLKMAVVYGDAADRMGAALEAAGCRTIYATNLKSAFTAALKGAAAGDTILLAPACSSFDEFKSFEERGMYFCQLVKAWYKRVQQARAEK